MPRADMQHPPTVKSAVVKTRMTPAEVAAIGKAAARVGLPVATWLRAIALDAVTGAPTATVVPPRPALADSDVRALAEARAAIARTGGLANQLVREVHRGVIHEAAIGDAVRDLSALCRHLVEQLGGRAW